MEKEMNRREFLKATTATGAIFLMGNIPGDSAPAQDRIKIPEAEKIIITVITDNLADLLHPDYKIAKRPSATTSILEAAMHAEHGLSYHVETTVVP